jgi:hypothetical protein
MDAIINVNAISSEVITVKRALVACVAFLFVKAAFAGDAYVIRFRTFTYYFAPPCYRVYWLDELLFHNATSSDLVVRLTSSTPGTYGPSQVTVPAGRTISSEGLVLPGTAPESTIAVDRFDLPEGVAMASRAGVFGPNYPNTPCGVGEGANFNFGSLPLPVFRQLVPANQSQVHIGADLGQANRHTNVIVYNGGDAVATARIEYRAACDERLIEFRTITLQPNTVVQLAGFTDSIEEGCSTELASSTTRYVVVTMDQPGFSNVMTVSNEFQTPTIGVTAASGP